MIKRVLEDIKIAYNNKAYFSALALTLTIPDICGKIQYKNDTNLKDREKYIKWFDEWIKEYFEINYKYSTAKRYKEAFRNIKRELGNYKLSAITPYILNQALLKLYQTSSTRDALRNYQKVIKSSLRDASYYFGFIKNNPAAELEIPRVLSFELKKRCRSQLYQTRNRKNSK